ETIRYHASLVYAITYTGRLSDLFFFRLSARRSRSSDRFTNERICVPARTKTSPDHKNPFHTLLSSNIRFIYAMRLAIILCVVPHHVLSY
ncbi:MAG: hypothetical protein IJ418_24630, partial [Clostridia bacterium]|nr:hypothetical protein [Clostridia bacterium]